MRLPRRRPPHEEDQDQDRKHHHRKDEEGVVEPEHPRLAQHLPVDPPASVPLTSGTPRDGRQRLPLRDGGQRRSR